MITIIILLWILLGLTSLVPYMEPNELGSFSIGKQIFTLILFIVLGPLIATSVLIHLLLFYFFGGNSNNFQQ